MIDAEQEAGTTIGFDVQEAGIVEVDVTVHKPSAVGWSETLGLEQAFLEPITTELQYEIYGCRIEPAPLWQRDKVGPIGRPKRNKSKLKQQRKSRRRNRR